MCLPCNYIIYILNHWILAAFMPLLNLHTNDCLCLCPTSTLMIAVWRPNSLLILTVLWCSPLHGGHRAHKTQLLVQNKTNVPWVHQAFLQLQWLTLADASWKALWYNLTWHHLCIAVRCWKFSYSFFCPRQHGWDLWLGMSVWCWCTSGVYMLARNL